jgi:hypothetical protein
LVNRKGDTVHIKDEDNEQYEIPSNIPINGSKTEGIMAKEEWSDLTFDKFDWSDFETAFK